MTKRKSKNNLIGIIMLIALLAVGIFYFVEQTALTDIDDLTYTFDYTNGDNVDIRGLIGTFKTTGYMQLPENSKEFSFRVTPQLSADDNYGASGSCNADYTYKILNQKTGLYETITTKSWSLKNIDSADLNYEGLYTHQTGIPSQLELVTTRYSKYSADRRYILYLSCPEGMSTSQAQQIACEQFGFTACTNSVKYSFQCIYEEGYVNEHDDGDDSDEDWDIDYFPTLYTYGEDYISENNTVDFDMSITFKTKCAQPSTLNDFPIQLIDLKTTIVPMYSYDSTNNVCNPIDRYTYNIEPTDFGSLDDCEYESNITECYLDEHCADVEDMVKSCNQNVCEYTDKNIFVKLKNNFSGGMAIIGGMIIISLSLIGLIIKKVLQLRK